MFSEDVEANDNDQMQDIWICKICFNQFYQLGSNVLSSTNVVKVRRNSWVSSSKMWKIKMPRHSPYHQKGWETNADWLFEFQVQDENHRNAPMFN